MKYLYLIISFQLLCLQYTFAQFPIRERKSGLDLCPNYETTYFAKQEVTVYANMDEDSAEKGIISKGQGIRVINSFFGGVGWWEVCYMHNLSNLLDDGRPTTGWVLKDKLQGKAQTTPEYNDLPWMRNTTTQNTQLGISQLSTAIRNCNLRAAPNTSSVILGTLFKNESIEILKTSGEWFKVSYNGILGGKYGTYVGWVHKSNLVE